MSEDTIQQTRRGVLHRAGAVLAGGLAVSSTAGSAAAADDGFEVTTLDPGWASESAAYLLGEITTLDDGHVSRWYFEYGVAGEGLPNETLDRNCTDRFGRCQEEGETLDKYLYSLQAGTSYEVQIVAETGDGRLAKGGVVEFTTDGGGGGGGGGNDDSTDDSSDDSTDDSTDPSCKNNADKKKKC
ncbi:hypothetical protein [Haloarcula salinisoli]|uniref:Fibronectin type-III domain-containing protein n=1 Tax=Haloarcula salinisoli TaxID=2487746 RepID=A0A8J8C9T1_9EURY|nr:hypothetical protein [Halomicroarcula salinisoli]MBX0286249.1 hypothetical protein [Halomicroarcula salinisoli]MBX0302263.1 hypothetical protein [Halomicroarcula salinisoli]